MESGWSEDKVGSFVKLGMHLSTSPSWGALRQLRLAQLGSSMQKCIGEREFESHMRVHTEHKRVVAWWRLTLMEQQPVDWVERRAEFVFLSSEYHPHYSVPSQFGVTRPGIVLKCISSLNGKSSSDVTGLHCMFSVQLLLHLLGTHL